MKASQRLSDRAARRLGFRPADYLTKSYGALFMEQQGIARERNRKPSDGLPDMVFKPLN